MTIPDQPEAVEGTDVDSPEAEARVYEEEGSWICEIRIFTQHARAIRRFPELMSWSQPLEQSGYGKMPAAGFTETVSLLPGEGFVKRVQLAEKQSPLPPGQYRLTVRYPATADTPALLLKREFEVPARPPM